MLDGGRFASGFGLKCSGGAFTGIFDVKGIFGVEDIFGDTGVIGVFGFDSAGGALTVERAFNLSIIDTVFAAARSSSSNR